MTKGMHNVSCLYDGVATWGSLLEWHLAESLRDFACGTGPTQSAG